MLNQKPNHSQVITGSSTVQRCPPIRILRVNITSKQNQELDNVKVACADGVVQCSDSLVVGRAGVRYLSGGFLDKVKFSLK